ncbi:hypothetical protein N7492_007934 [Penicillium capsulatum]|uniref:Peptidase S8/S53 domain-containing protein n=1 Tax=Penicillium capsulatum TaxID=69766 RepID=A0A9W9LLB7_9EURO|nr:hypothetical protein N7492_007934 [Penicillium capsulatum]KAJ6117763.1 hypothetical protein N7512_007488 [Penicillium capsulatum]
MALLTLIFTLGFFVANVFADDIYLIRSKEGTSFKDFQLWTDHLDGGAGYLDPDQSTNYLTYLTSLTVARADAIREEDIISSISVHEIDLIEFHKDDSNSTALNRLRHSKRETNRPTPNQRNGYPAMQWKFLNYNGRGSPPYGPPEFRTDSGGAGVNLFVIDSGFNVDLDELEPVQTYYPEDFHYDQVPGTLLPGTIKEHTVHGTVMASAAGGKTLGIAPNTNLYLAKWDREYKDAKGQVLPIISIKSMEAVFNWVIDRMDEQWSKGLTKNVVLFSLGVDRGDKTNREKYDRVFQSFVDRLDGYESLLFAAAGNDGLNKKSLADKYPACLAKPNNNVVIVGAVNIDGTLWDETTPPKDSGLEINVWAPGTSIDVMLPNGDVRKNDNNGATSIATAITSHRLIGYYPKKQKAGLGAWFLGLDECEASDYDIDLRKLYDRYGQPKVMGLKNLIIDSSYQRSSRIIQAGKPYPTYALPTKLNAIYNLAQGWP